MGSKFFFMSDSPANPQKSQNAAATKKNEKPTMTAAALAPKNDSQITFAMK